jgi:hypothetical protein
MSKVTTLAHEFVEFIPDTLEEGKLYVSIAHATAAHKCCCGCGKEVVTPLSPTDWKLIFDGKTVSLDPSIGNWSFPCRSHYWIRNDGVRWAAQWSKDRIEAGRAHDRVAKQNYFSAGESKPDVVVSEHAPLLEPSKSRRSFWQKLKWW